MSVNIHGIKGYEYQYKVSVLVALIKKDECEALYIEKVGNEDILLQLKLNNEIQNVEIQVKKIRGVLSMAKLLEWLLHFQEWKSNNNLLSRITEEKNTLCLFVTTARCNDQVSILIEPFKSIKTTKRKLNGDWKENILATFKKINFDETKPLQKKRKEFCKIQFKQIKDDKTKFENFKKIIIWEQLSEENIDLEIIRMLNEENQIAQSDTEDVYLHLLELVKQGRDQKNDIISLVKQKIDKNKINRPILNEPYYEREEEFKLIKQLESDSVILLTGLSQCGKSEVAKKVATHFFMKGYDYKATDDINELKRFFSEREQDNKIVLLEDIWGHIERINNAEEIKNKIKYILEHKKVNHKLIITSKVEILYDIFYTNAIDECNLNQFNWHNLTIRKNEVVNGFWIKIATDKRICQSILNLVSDGLLQSDSNYLLQIGQLSQLANSKENLENKTFEELDHLARKGFKDLANSIKEKGQDYSTILAILAMNATKIVTIHFKELAFITSVISSNIEKPKILPSLMDLIDHLYTITLEGDSRNSKLPNYQENYKLSETTEAIISYLERRGFIRINNNEIIFTHPNYYETGRYLFVHIRSNRQQEKILTYLERSIFSLNSRNAQEAVKQLYFFYKKIHEDFKYRIIELAFNGLNSRFPLVQDEALRILIALMNDLDENSFKQFIEKLQMNNSYNRRIAWADKYTPFVSGLCILRERFKHDQLLTDETLIELRNNRLPVPYKIWSFVHTFDQFHNLDIISYKTLLQSEYSFIREEVARRLFEQEIDDQKREVISLVFTDEHPNVVFTGIRTFLNNWFGYSNLFRNDTLRLIKKALNKIVISVTVFKFLIVDIIKQFCNYPPNNSFSRIKKEQKREFWNNWAELYFIVVNTIPLEIQLYHTYRFYDDLLDIGKYLNVINRVKILDIWLERVYIQISKEYLLDYNNLNVSFCLMELTEKKYSVREAIFKKIINFENTSFTLKNLEHIILFWKNLHVSEKRQVISLLKASRKDVRWIKATFLSVSFHPEEIIFEILGERNFSKKEVPYILSKFPEQLLQDSLNIYWEYVDHKNEIFWVPIIKYILINEHNVGFNICLLKFLNNCINGYIIHERYIKKWGNGFELWHKICHNVSNKSILLKCLMYNVSTCSVQPKTTKSIWSILISVYEELDKTSDIKNEIYNNIEMLQQTGDEKDLLSMFGNPTFFFTEIISKSYIDNQILILIGKLKEEREMNEEIESQINNLLDSTRNEHIRFLVTIDCLQKKINEGKLSEKLGEKLNEVKDKINKRGKKAIAELEEELAWKREDWIGIY